MRTEQRIILDCDPGEDDALAILLAFARKLEVVGLVCGFGNTSVEKTYRNGAGLLALVGRSDVPLFKGAEKPYMPHPLERETVSAGAFVGENGLCGVELPPVPEEVLSFGKLPQVERIAAIAAHMRLVGPVTYIVTGPCATLAYVLDLLGDEAKTLIAEVIVMGGALDAAGNEGPVNPETGKPYAEFNFYCDPHAVDRVFASSVPIRLVPWDLTERIVLGYGELDGWQSDMVAGTFVLDLMRNFLESYGNAHARQFEFNDCITLTAFEGRGEFRRETVAVLLEGEQAGRLVRDAAGREVRMFDINPAQIMQERNAILGWLGIEAKDGAGSKI